MKIRKGFVSNSSSSSFVCDICRSDYSGFDASLSDAGMSECVNGHTICDKHLVEDAEKYDDMSFADKKKYCLTLDTYYEDKIIEIEDEDELDEFYEENLEYEARYNIPSNTCPCCELISPTSDQVLKYMLFEKNKSREDVEDEMRTRFSNYDEMLKKINGE